MANFPSHVENLCKTPGKTSCKSPAKLCANLPTHILSCVNLHFPTDFSHVFNNFFHHASSPVPSQFIPQFHNPYYYNYK